MWFGLDSPHGSAYLPFYGAASTGAPDSYHSHEGFQSKFSKNVAWWAFNLVNQYQDLNFRAINADVRQRAREIESRAMRLTAMWEEEAKAVSPRGASLAVLTARSNAFAEDVVAGWWNFSTTLFAKYGRYVVTYNESENGESMAGQAYPEWWVRSPEVGFSTWAPQGPYHGMLLSAQVSPRWSQPALENSSLPASLVTKNNVPMVFVLWLLSATFLAGIAHQVGVRQGRESLDIHQEYVHYP